MIDAGKEVVDFRKAHGLSQKKLAELMGVTHLTIMRWEKRIRLDAVIGRAFRDLERELSGGQRQAAPKSTEGEYISLLEAIGITIEEWHAVDDVEIRLGMMKKAARISPRLYKKAYEEDLKKAGMDDEDIEEWEGVV